jgi:hypothetical protein
MLRVYAAAHGMNSTHHAVVEIGKDEIVLRVDTRWLRFTEDRMQGSVGESQTFVLNEDGTVRIGVTTDEMDMAAERVARQMLTNSTPLVAVT